MRLYKTIKFFAWLILFGMMSIPVFAGPLTIDGTHIQKDGQTINPVLASAFGLFREDTPIEKTKAYIDIMHSFGVRGFRVWNLLIFEDGKDADWAIGWVWGGFPCPKRLQDRSILNEAYFQRIEEVLQYLRSKNMYALWSLSDASAFISKMGTDWYTSQNDDGWILYLDRVAQIWLKYQDVLIVSTANEPGKSHPNHNAVVNHQTWLVNYLWDKGVRNIAGPGDWIKEFKTNPRVQILEIATNRIPDDSCVSRTVDELNAMLAYGKPVISSEPPRLWYTSWPNEPYFRNLLFSVAQATINTGSWFCWHGLSDLDRVHVIDQGGRAWFGCDVGSDDLDGVSMIGNLTGVTK